MNAFKLHQRVRAWCGQGFIRYGVITSLERDGAMVRCDGFNSSDFFYFQDLS